MFSAQWKSGKAFLPIVTHDAGKGFAKVSQVVGKWLASGWQVVGK